MNDTFAAKLNALPSIELAQAEALFWPSLMLFVGILAMIAFAICLHEPKHRFLKSVAALAVMVATIVPGYAISQSEQARAGVLRTQIAAQCAELRPMFGSREIPSTMRERAIAACGKTQPKAA